MVCIEIERLYCLGPNVPDFANVEATEFDKCELLVGFQKVDRGRGESGRYWGKWTIQSPKSGQSWVKVVVHFPSKDRLLSPRLVECAGERFKFENQPDFFFWIFFLVSWARKSSVKMQCKVANHCKHCLNHILDYANIEQEEIRTVGLQ